MITATSVAVDSNRNVYVGGYSYATWGSPVRPYTGNADGFIALIPDPFTLTVNKAGEGSGSITGTGITCAGTVCTGTYLSGSQVALTASADSSSTFAGWSGGDCSGTGTCTVTMTADTIVTASFAKAIYTVNASVSGGNGGVSPTTQSVTHGSSASITMTPDTGYHIEALTDDAAAGAKARVRAEAKKTGATPSRASRQTARKAIANPYAISNVTANHNVVVTYGADTFTLTVTMTGDGTGTITASPAITCTGTTCTGTYPYSTQVTLTAAPVSPSTFTGWTGGGCSGTSSCVVTVTADTSVSASFDSPCVYKAAPARLHFSARGGSRSVTVSAKGASTCPGPQVTPGGTGFGAVLSSWRNNRGTVIVTAEEMTTSPDRAGSLTIVDQTVTLSQKGIPCAITRLAPASHSVPVSGESSTFDITLSTQDCEWSAAANKTWVNITADHGTGNGTISYTVPANETMKNRTATVTVTITGNQKKKVRMVTQKGR